MKDDWDSGVSEEAVGLRDGLALDGENSCTNEPGSRTEPSFGCFSTTIDLPGLLPICTRSESLLVVLVRRAFFFSDPPFLALPLAFPRRFLLFSGLLLVAGAILFDSR